MSERVLPVVMRVVEHGVVRNVRVGQAFVTDDEVTLSLEPMTVQRAPVTAAPRTVRPGRMADLEWLAQRSRRLLDDPRKHRWHAEAQRQLACIEEEMERLRERGALVA